MLALFTGQACATNGRSAPILASVEVQGVEQVDEGALVEGLESQGPSGILFVQYTPHDPLALERDHDRIIAFYRSRGFFNPTVEVATNERADGDADVHIAIHEGVRARLTGVDIVGLPDGFERDLPRWLHETQMEAGAPFDHTNYLRLKAEIDRALPRRGFAFATVSGRVQVNREGTEVRVDITATPGGQAHFGQTRIGGNQETPVAFLQYRVAWAPGMPYELDLIDLTRKRLYETGRFGLAEITSQPQRGGLDADMEVRVEEAPSREVRLGIGVGVDRVRYEARARASYVEHGFLSPLLTLRLQARPAFVWLRAEDGESGPAVDAKATLELDDFFIARLRWSNTIGYSAVENLAYALRGPSGETRLDRAFLRDRLRIGIGWGIRLGTFSRIEAAVSTAERERVALNSPYRIAYLSQTAVFDHRDDPIEARSGYYLELTAEEASPLVGSSRSFLRLIAEGRGYLPLHRRVTGAARVRSGSNLASRGQLPITQRFFAGGANSQRGFSQQTLAPGTAADPSLPIGGEALFESNFELRVDLFELGGSWIAAVGFLDGADAPAALDRLALGHLHWAAGGGLRYRSPVGVVRLDFGFRLNRKGPTEPQPDSSWAFHLSLGEAF